MPGERGERPPPPEDVLAARAFGERLQAAKQAQLGDATADEPTGHQEGDEQSKAWPRFGDQRDEGVIDDKIRAAYERLVEREGTPEAQAAWQIQVERSSLPADRQLPPPTGPPAERIRAQQAGNSHVESGSGADRDDQKIRPSSPDAPPRPRDEPPKHRAEIGADDKSAEPAEPAEPEMIRRIRADHGDRDAGPDEPTGEELLGGGERESRWERLLRKGAEQGDDWSDAASEIVELIEDLRASRPAPTSEGALHPSYPYVIDQPRHGVESDNVTGAAFVTLVTLGAAYKKLHSMLSDWRRPTDAGD